MNSDLFLRAINAQISALDTPVILVDRNGTILTFNHPAQEKFTCDLFSLLGESIESLGRHKDGFGAERDCIYIVEEPQEKQQPESFVPGSISIPICISAAAPAKLTPLWAAKNESNRVDDSTTMADDIPNIQDLEEVPSPEAPRRRSLPLTDPHDEDFTEDLLFNY